MRQTRQASKRTQYRRQAINSNESPAMSPLLMRQTRQASKRTQYRRQAINSNESPAMVGLVQLPYSIVVSIVNEANKASKQAHAVQEASDK
ncbi:hypothetical protein J6590_035886 [Homalodisca vitripennis]|nr:hypothetical protein J6590_035886 [Homalodisca vitripennis]